MNTKQLMATALLSALVVPTLHAAETQALETQELNQTILVAEAKSQPLVEAPSVPVAGKSRVQVVNELLEAIQDGSYVPPSELYPASTAGSVQH